MDDLTSWPAQQLAARGCAGSAEEELVWACIHELQRRGGLHDFAVAVEALTSQTATCRAFGANVLGQLGYQTPLEERPFRQESITRLLDVAATETDLDVVDAIAVALCWLEAAPALPWLTSLRAHPDADLRHSLAAMLPQFGPAQPEAVEVLVELLDDEDTGVRDWASFAFTNHLAHAEHPGLHQALHRRVHDQDRTTAAQAMHALAVRGDTTVLPALTTALSHPPDDSTGELIEAAAALPDPVILPALLNLQATAEWADDEDLTHLIHLLQGSTEPDVPGRTRSP